MLRLTVTLSNAQAAAVCKDLAGARDLRADEMANDQPDPLADDSTAAYKALTVLLDALQAHGHRLDQADRRERATRLRAFQRRKARGERERTPTRRDA